MKINEKINVRVNIDEEYNKRRERESTKLEKPMDLIKASELVLQELSNMTDEDLVLALEACEDNSIGYAVCSEENKS